MGTCLSYASLGIERGLLWWILLITEWSLTINKWHPKQRGFHCEHVPILTILTVQSLTNPPHSLIWHKIWGFVLTLRVCDPHFLQNFCLQSGKGQVPVEHIGIDTTDLYRHPCHNIGFPGTYLLAYIATQISCCRCSINSEKSTSSSVELGYMLTATPWALWSSRLEGWGKH